MARTHVTNLEQIPRPFPIVVALLHERTGIRMSTQRANRLCDSALRKMLAAFSPDDDPVPNGERAYRPGPRRKGKMEAKAGT